MKKFPERLKEVRGGLSQRKFAESLGVAHQRISDYENGGVSPTLEFFQRIEDKLNVNLNWLVNGEGEMHLPEDDDMMVKEGGVSYGKSKLKKVAVVGEVECGVPLQSWQAFGNEFVELSGVGHLNMPFVLKAKGNSMYPYIRAGDQLLCADEPNKIKDGSVVAVSFKTEPETAEANAKLIRFPDKKHVMLYSVNSNFNPVIHHIKEIYKIFKVVKIMRDVK